MGERSLPRSEPPPRYDQAWRRSTLLVLGSPHRQPALAGIFGCRVANQRAIEEARARTIRHCWCVALAWAAGFVSLSLGELDQADDFGEELVATGYKSSLRPFYAAGLCIRGALAARRSAPEAAVDSLRSGLAQMQEARYLLFYPFFRAELALMLGAMGRLDESLREIDDTLRFALETDHRWYVPEILRMKGELLALRGLDDPILIEDLYRRAIRQGGEHQAHFWELTAATSLAGHLKHQRRLADALSVLSSPYNRLSEGFAFSRVGEANSFGQSCLKSMGKIRRWHIFPSRMMSTFGSRIPSSVWPSLGAKLTSSLGADSRRSGFGKPIAKADVIREAAQYVSASSL